MNITPFTNTSSLSLILSTPSDCLTDSTFQEDLETSEVLCEQKCTEITPLQIALSNPSKYIHLLPLNDYEKEYLNVLQTYRSLEKADDGIWAGYLDLLPVEIRKTLVTTCILTNHIGSKFLNSSEEAFYLVYQKCTMLPSKECEAVWQLIKGKFNNRNCSSSTLLSHLHFLILENNLSISFIHSILQTISLIHLYTEHEPNHPQLKICSFGNGDSRLYFYSNNNEVYDEFQLNFNHSKGLSHLNDLLENGEKLSPSDWSLLNPLLNYLLAPIKGKLTHPIKNFKLDFLKVQSLVRFLAFHEHPSLNILGYYLLLVDYAANPKKFSENLNWVSLLSRLKKKYTQDFFFNPLNNLLKNIAEIWKERNLSFTKRNYEKEPFGQTTKVNSWILTVETAVETRNWEVAFFYALKILSGNTSEEDRPKVKECLINFILKLLKCQDFEKKVSLISLYAFPLLKELHRLNLILDDLEECNLFIKLLKKSTVKDILSQREIFEGVNILMSVFHRSSFIFSSEIYVKTANLINDLSSYYSRSKLTDLLFPIHLVFLHHFNKNLLLENSLKFFNLIIKRTEIFDKSPTLSEVGLNTLEGFLESEINKKLYNSISILLIQVLKSKKDNLEHLISLQSSFSDIFFEQKMFFYWSKVNLYSPNKRNIENESRAVQIVEWIGNNKDGLKITDKELVILFRLIKTYKMKDAELIKPLLRQVLNSKNTKLFLCVWDLLKQVGSLENLTNLFTGDEESCCECISIVSNILAQLSHPDLMIIVKDKQFLPSILAIKEIKVKSELLKSIFQKLLGIISKNKKGLETNLQSIWSLRKDVLDADRSLIEKIQNKVDSTLLKLYENFNSNHALEVSIELMAGLKKKNSEEKIAVYLLKSLKKLVESKNTQPNNLFEKIVEITTHLHSNNLLKNNQLPISYYLNNIESDNAKLLAAKIFCSSIKSVNNRLNKNLVNEKKNFTDLFNKLIDKSSLKSLEILKDLFKNTIRKIWTKKEESMLKETILKKSFSLLKENEKTDEADAIAWLEFFIEYLKALSSKNDKINVDCYKLALHANADLLFIGNTSAFASTIESISSILHDRLSDNVTYLNKSPIFESEYLNKILIDHLWVSLHLNIQNKSIIHERFLGNVCVFLQSPLIRLESKINLIKEIISPLAPQTVEFKALHKKTIKSIQQIAEKRSLFSQYPEIERTLYLYYCNL